MKKKFSSKTSLLLHFVRGAKRYFILSIVFSFFVTALQLINPKIIGYDEPTSALDPELRLEVEKLILQNKELGITQIVVTHDLQFAENIADSILKVEPK